MSTLDEYSRIIAEMGDERRKREDEAYATALAEIEETKCSIAALSNDDLLAFVVCWIGTSDPRMMQLNADLRQFAVGEALRRMKPCP